jgi:hypothetical protein
VTIPISYAMLSAIGRDKGRRLQLSMRFTRIGDLVQGNHISSVGVTLHSDLYTLLVSLSGELFSLGSGMNVCSRDVFSTGNHPVLTPSQFKSS